MSKQAQKKTTKSKSKTLESIVRILCDTLILGEEEVTLNAHLQEDLHADSIDLVEITVCIEEEFSIELTENDTESCMTVRKLLKMVDAKLLVLAA